MKCKTAIEELHNELDETNKLKNQIEENYTKLEKDIKEKESNYIQERSSKERLEGKK